MNNQEEIWKDIPGYENKYQASDLGSIKTMRRKVPGWKGGMRKEKLMVLTTDNHGYLRVNLRKDNGYKCFQVHRLVVMTFEGLTDGLVVDHINNIKTDNRAINLQQITQRLNTSKDQKNRSSKYIGVTWCKQRKRWVAQIVISKRLKKLGRFLIEKDASDAYQNKLKEIQDAEKHRHNRQVQS